MSRVIYALPGAERMADRLVRRTGARAGQLAAHRFPDGEHLVRILDDPAGERTVIVADLSRPDMTLLPLLFAADALRDLGAKSVGLVAPYLPYMRQDRRFRPGEAVSSATFGRLLSRAVDSLVTVDPHLHRRASLDEIFSIPTQVVSIADAIGRWIGDNAPDALVVGPDEESGQWARAAAARAGVPCVLLRKERRGDREVVVAGPDLRPYAGRLPVIVDDIVSTGGTVRETAAVLDAVGMALPMVVVVHALTSPRDLARLSRVIVRLVSADTVTHSSNAIPVDGLIAQAMKASDM